MPSIPQQSLKPKASSDAKYPYLVEHLASQIRDGILRVGDRLPTFVELQAHFGVTPHTVNRAMIALEHRGLVERRPRQPGVCFARSS